MHSQNNEVVTSSKRRKRLHELLIALINQQQELELMDGGDPIISKSNTKEELHDSARWLDRNKRILKRYQSLVRSAVALDALLDSEQY